MPDIDSIFYFTRIKDRKIIFTKNYPLIYQPGNFVPINSKNTRYLYEIFPLLMFSLSLEEILQIYGEDILFNILLGSIMAISFIIIQKFFRFKFYIIEIILF